MKHWISITITALTLVAALTGPALELGPRALAIVGARGVPAAVPASAGYEGVVQITVDV